MYLNAAGQLRDAHMWIQLSPVGAVLSSAWLPPPCPSLLSTAGRAGVWRAADDNAVILLEGRASAQPLVRMSALLA